MIGLAWAQARDRVIGAGGTVPFDLPEDRRRFAARTRGSVVVMGRATWDSLPARYRPLPGRRNVVLTRQRGWSADGAERAGSLEAALRAALAPSPAGPADVWVIGGAEVYAAALDPGLPGPLVPDVVEVTDVDVDVGPPADGSPLVRAPGLDGRWRVVASDPPQGWHVSTTGLRHRFVTHRRTGA